MKMSGYFSVDLQAEIALAYKSVRLFLTGCLQEALTLAPDLIKEWLKNNPELVAVRDQSA